MLVSRLVGVAAVVAGLGWSSGHATATESGAPLAANCSASALTASLTNLAASHPVAAFGCDGPWAYLWATVSVGPNQIGVTELMHYDAVRATWLAASRATYCKPGALPAAIYQGACFSN